jgi:tetratricopeptide (TPR) repeat protein
MEVGAGTSIMQLFWQQDKGLARELVPAANLFHDPATFAKLKAWLPEDEKRFFESEPKDAKGYLLRAEAHHRTGKDDKALADYRRFLTLLASEPKSADEFGAMKCNNMAWQFATGPDRHPVYAEVSIGLAERACRMEPNHHLYIDTLAAAYALDRKFAKAIEIQEQAIRLAPNERKAEYTARLELYRANKTFPP